MVSVDVCGVHGYVHTIYRSGQRDVALDIEVLYLVERQRLSLCEVPVQVANSEQSTVRVVRDTARLLRDLFRIRIFARNGDYDVPGSSTDRASTIGSSAV